MTVSVRVLGEVAVGSAALTRRRERDLLAMLVAAREPVAVDRILDELWSGRVSRASLHVLVSRLRGSLGTARDGARIELGPAGYQLVLAQVDAWEFEEVAERTLRTSSPADRLVGVTRAEELWSGSPFPGVEVASVRTVASRLDDLHLAVQEARAECLLSLGHPAAAARVLAPLVEVHPFREQIWALLARAQYASARQADALATLATVRTRLAEDLGVQLSPGLRDLELRILRQDVPGTAAEPAVTRAVCVAHRRVRVRGCRASSVTGPVHSRS